MGKKRLTKKVSGIRRGPRLDMTEHQLALLLEKAYEAGRMFEHAAEIERAAQEA